MQLLYRQGNRRHFLHELGADLFGDSRPAGSRHEHAGIVAVDAYLGFHALQEFKALFRLLGFMALVILPQHLITDSVDHHRLHGRGAHI